MLPNSGSFLGPGGYGNRLERLARYIKKIPRKVSNSAVRSNATIGMMVMMLGEMDGRVSEELITYKAWTSKLRNVRHFRDI